MEHIERIYIFLIITYFVRGTVVVPLYSDMNNKGMDWPLIIVVMKTEICTVTTSAVGLAPLSLQQMQQGKGIFLVMFDICFGNCGIAHILSILLMNSYDICIFPATIIVVAENILIII